MNRKKSLYLVGNPNVGKSVIFNYLTGRYATVSNYPGTTVEVSRGTSRDTSNIVVTDTPGATSLFPSSEDEQVTRDILLDAPPSQVILVADAKNVERAIFLLFQLAYFDHEITLVLNMMDEVAQRGLYIDISKISSLTGVPVLTAIAVNGKGLKPLLTGNFPSAKNIALVPVPEEYQDAFSKILNLLPEDLPHRKFIALSLTVGDRTILKHIRGKLTEGTLSKLEDLITSQKEGQSRLSAFLRLLNHASYQVAQSAISEKKGAELPRGEFLGRLLMHPVWGVPFALLMLYGLYLFVGVLGAGYSVDFFEGVLFGEYIKPAVIKLFDLIFNFPHLHMKDPDTGVIIAEYTVTSSLTLKYEIVRNIHDLFVGEYGILTMALPYAFAIIFPIVTFFFVAFGILEDSGYMPRLAVLMDSWMKKIGLNGKAVLPLILGLGCDTMATITTRILDTTREKIITTLLLALAIPCSAQIGVIFGMLQSLPGSGILIWLATVVGVLFTVGFLSNLVLPQTTSFFIMNVPPMRVPVVQNVIIKTLFRLEWYLKEAVPLFIIGTLILYLMNLFGILTLYHRTASPVIAGWLHLPPEAGDAFLLGFLRRDYGAAGLYALQRAGELSPLQTLVSIITITLFVPCIANFLVIIKERGLKVAIGVVAFIIPFAFLVGGIMRIILSLAGWH